MHLLRIISSEGRPPRIVWALLGLAAAAVGVAGYLHGHLFWEGYSHVDVVGPLFWLNTVGSGVVIALLLVGRPLLFALGGLSISLASAVSILISHTTSFFGFAEHAYDARATAIVVAELVAAGLVLLALAIARSRITVVSASGATA
jgi:hypothetical protein